MAVKNRILKLKDIDMKTGAEYETDVYMFKKKFMMAGLPEELVIDLIRKQVEPQKIKLMELGLTEKEATKRIEKLIETESEPLNGDE